ncbi:MAG: type I DNA topoisomerase, partial [Sphaerochaetaceae bacterium]
MDKKEKVLIIVESPTKARTIKKFLPKNYSVVASNGHIRDLPSKDLAIDIDKGYLPHYEIPKGKSKIIKEIKSELTNSSSLLLATDEDREGESIAWHLVELLKPKVPYQRMVFHEITKKAILYALEHGRQLNMDLVNAQEARRILDRLYGYTLSPFLWRKLSLQKLSAGRVQSPGLRMVVERERERIKFVSSIYWDLKAQLTSPSDQQKIIFDARLEALGDKKVATGKDFDSDSGQLKKARNVVLLDEKKALQLAQELKDKEWKVLSVEKREKKQRPSAPFITSTLQQEGSRKLHLSAKETMRIAQKLYESGLITYMRTDSPSLSQEGIRAARDAAEKLFGSEYLSPSSRQYTSKSATAQEAHEAIRPAGEHFVHPDETSLSPKEKSLYDLIWKRTLASQMADAIKATSTAKIEVGDATFGATGNTILFPGFIRVYVEGKDDPEAALEDKERLLPNLKEKEVVSLKALEAEIHETKPPFRFTEATLVQQLEKEGIGRPSTYATIIDKLFEKEYVIKENSALIPTFIGFGVIQLLEEHFSDLVDYNFTSHMENKLDSIAEGKENQLHFLK